MSFFKKLIFVPILLLLGLYGFAQDLIQTNNEKVVTVVNAEADLFDIIHKIFKRNALAPKKISKVHISLIPFAGYSLQTGFASVLSANFAFSSIAQNISTSRISSISTSIAYTQYKQIIFPIQGNIWTKNNIYNIINDNRYLKYPSTTYGLGPHSSLSNGYTVDFSYLKLHETVLRKVVRNLYAGLGYYLDYFWNVKEVNPPAGTETDFQKYGLYRSEKASGIATRVSFDSRKNQINPSEGWYGNMIFRSNSEILGSDNNWQSLLLELRHYFHLAEYSKNVLAVWSYNWFTFGKPPYLMLPSTGWDDAYSTGRGFIQGRYRGKQFIYLETEYRFGITVNGLLGGVVFANAETVSKAFPENISDIKPAAGAGIRIKLNKFSGANLCIDYGVGTNGSRGIFVNLGEVF